MDINTLRGLATIFTLIAFLAVTFWAFSKRKKRDFDAAAQIPLKDDGIVENNLASSSQDKNKQDHNREENTVHSHKNNHTEISSL